MSQNVYIVTCNGKPDSAFTDPAKAEAYALKENNLDKQRHPQRTTHWRALPGIEVDAKAQ